jgi:hypothetical protein
VITTQFQDANSHVALKSRERGTPDVYYKNATSDPKLIALNNQPIRFFVAANNFTIEPATEDDVQRFYDKGFVSSWTNLTFTPYPSILSYDFMCNGSSPAVCLDQNYKFGSKASNLGFLRRVYGSVSVPGFQSTTRRNYTLSPDGFGIPFTFFEQFVAANPRIREAIADLEYRIRYEDLPVDQVDLLAANIRNLTLNATVPASILSSVYTGLYGVFGDVLTGKVQLPVVEPKGIKFKFRSSANAEDIPNCASSFLFLFFFFFLFVSLSFPICDFPKCVFADPHILLVFFLFFFFFPSLGRGAVLLVLGPRQDQRDSVHQDDQLHLQVRGR